MRYRSNTEVLLPLVIVLAACAPAEERGEAAMEETVSAAAGMEAIEGQAQVDPNIPAPVILENDEVIAQLWVSEPGVWAGCRIGTTLRQRRYYPCPRGLPDRAADS